MKLKHQKYCIIFILFSINLILSSTFIIYVDKWYCYLFILAFGSLINSSSCILNIGYKMFNNDNDNDNNTENINRTTPRNYMYIMPCYNESREELISTLNSLVLQREVKNDKRFILIICDGTSINNNNICDKVLKKILNLDGIANNKYLSYVTWDKKINVIQIYKTVYTYLTESLPVILIVKNLNYGKRDSLVLARSLCHIYNNMSLYDSLSNININNVNINKININTALTNEMIILFHHVYYGEKIDYIIGIDADTVFDYNCSYELIQGIDNHKSIHGCVGYVDISPSSNFTSLFILYQYAEYMFAQCLRRYTQSNITNKVSCLSGCVQILRISEETCGEMILNIFNYLPSIDENIFNHIRSYASEDRNHVCHLLSLYPHVKTKQNLKAISYTNVPTNLSVFLSQRRRWSLGANCNDMLLIYLPNILLVERISAFVNVMTYSLIPFIFIATVIFIKSIITNPTMLMLYLSIIILIPLFYSFLIIPIFIRPLSFRNAMYYYISYIFFISVSSIVNIIIYIYSIASMDVIKWGKTREIKQIVLEYSNEEISMVDDYYYDLMI